MAENGDPRSVINALQKENYQQTKLIAELQDQLKEKDQEIRDLKAILGNRRNSKSDKPYRPQKDFIVENRLKVMKRSLLAK